MAAEKHTLEDVARLAGVSRTSASRVFLGQNKVSDETRRRVREAATKLGYVPNTYASNLASGSSDMVGLLLRDAANPAYGLLFTELQVAAAERGMNLVSKTITVDPEGSKQIAALDMLLGLRVSGLIVATGSLPSEQLTPFAQQIPIIRAGRPEPTQEIHAISYDERASGRELAQFVIDRGHRKVAVVQNAADVSYPEWVRADSMISTLEAGGADVEIISIDHSDDGVARVLALVEAKAVTTVMCPSDMRGFAVLRAIEARGLGAPDDVSLSGCDGIIPGLDIIGLTTYRLGVASLAKRTIAALDQLLNGHESLIQEQIAGTLVPGTTVAERNA